MGLSGKKQQKLLKYELLKSASKVQKLWGGGVIPVWEEKKLNNQHFLFGVALLGSGYSTTCVLAL